jgi:hypothetical protein
MLDVSLGLHKHAICDQEHTTHACMDGLALLCTLMSCKVAEYGSCVPPLGHAGNISKL